jgi:hypothetical protein
MLSPEKVSAKIQKPASFRDNELAWGGRLEVDVGRHCELRFYVS